MGQARLILGTKKQKNLKRKKNRQTLISFPELSTTNFSVNVVLTTAAPTTILSPHEKQPHIVLSVQLSWSLSSILFYNFIT